MHKLAIAPLLLISACSRAPVTSDRSAEVATTCHDGGVHDGPSHATLLFQVIPGVDPNAYTEQATITINGVPLEQTFTIMGGGPRAETTLVIDSLAAGDTFDVSATFNDDTGLPPVTCDRSWTAVSQGSIACGPVEIGFFPATRTCNLVCD